MTTTESPAEAHPETRTAAAAEPQAPKPSRVEPGGGGVMREAFRRIYRFFYSKILGLVLILLMALVAFLGSWVIPQTTRATLANPTAKAEFLADVRQRWGGLTNLLDTFGLFHIFSSPAFILVTGLLALSIIACTTHRLPLLIRRIRAPRRHVARKLFDHARYRGEIAAQVPADRLLEIARAELKRRHFRVLADPKDERALYADRYSWGGMGTVAAHLSFVVILAAFVISGVGGIDEDLAVPVGGSVEVGHGSGLTVEAASFRDTYTEDGRPADYVSHLILRRGETRLAEQDVRVNSPLSFGGWRFHQQSFGVAADVVVKDGAGKTVYDESVPLIWTSVDETNSVGGFTVPDAGLDVLVFTPASGQVGSKIAAGSAVFRVHTAGSADENDAELKADPGKPVTAGDYTFTFERERQYAGIGLRRDPGTMWMWFGSILLVVGMTVTFMCRHRRLWVRADDGADGRNRLRFASAEAEDVGFTPLFSDIVRGAGAAVTAESATPREGRHE